MGTGIVEGIAAPESANNAVSGPSMILLLTLYSGQHHSGSFIRCLSNTWNNSWARFLIIQTVGASIFAFAAGRLESLHADLLGIFLAPGLAKDRTCSESYLYSFIF